ncbi:hypothetical protein [Halomicrococcus sp. NG-SE-24]|uniref:hypothetical protein n=1 Tax=Halomicrococcus sp. NG-SE-24 TaxID=3436928 RepID=UPI003D990B29
MSTTTTNRGEYEAETSHESVKLDALAFAGAAAIVSSVIMFLLGVFGAVGVYEGAVRMMEQWHLFFEPTVVGTVAGMIEAAVISFAFIYAFAWLYNVFAR